MNEKAEAGLAKILYLCGTIYLFGYEKIVFTGCFTGIDRI